MKNYDLYCDDCLDVMETLPEKTIAAVITDPPYCSGGRQQATARNIVTKANGRLPDEWFLGDNMGTDTYIRFMRQIARQCLRLCKLGAHGYVFTDWRQYTNIVTAWESVGWSLRGCLVWDKARGGAMGSFWRNNHEWVCIFTKGNPTPLPNGGYFNTWQGVKRQGGVHPTEKPIGLLEYMASAVKGCILDPFMGSGTTGVACAKVGNSFVGIEQDRVYFDVAQDRIKTAYGDYSETKLELLNVTTRASNNALAGDHKGRRGKLVADISGSVAAAPCGY